MKHISYLGSSLVFLALLFGMVEGWMSMSPLFHLLFGVVVFGSVAVAIPCLFAIKLHAMWVIDHSGSVAKRVSAPRKRKVDGPE